MFAVRKDVRTFVAFDLMSKHNISSVPVVTADNKLVGAISSSDIKGLKLGSFLLLTYPVGDYLDAVYRQLATRNTMSDSVVTILSSATLSEAVDLLNARRTHRLFVVSEDNQLLGLLSILDVLHCISVIDSAA